jgi:radical SAM superfamily enzyme YgiQ (UPF0313 family)
MPRRLVRTKQEGESVRYKKVLLVSPPSTSHYGGLRVPAGIGYVAQALGDAGIEYRYVDMRIGYGGRHLLKTARAFAPDLIGVSMTTLGYKATYGLMEDLARRLPGVRIVAGGHHVTVMRERVLQECAAVDFGVVGEGERAIVELCAGDRDHAAIAGLLYRDGAEVRFAGERPPATNLDEIAFPRYENIRMRDYSRQIPIHSSRGCVHQCIFCPNRFLGMKYRARSEGNFVDELGYWYGKGVRQFAIDDDNFAFNKGRVYRICDEIERRGLRGLFIRCSNGVRADCVDRDLLARMKEIGVREVGFGVDGGNDKTLRHLKKGETIATIERAIADACDLGLEVRLFFLVGTPHETAADVEDSMRLARKYPVGLINVNTPIPYPGTELFDYVQENDLFLLPPEEYLNSVSEEKAEPVFETPELPRQERIALLERFHAIEAEVMRNAAARVYRGRPIMAWLVRRCFSPGLFRRLFFQNLLFRRIVEWTRYRKILAEE